MKKYAVAIDGPSGAGKSTLSKRVAKELNLVYVDTGAIYRSVGLFCFQNGIDPQNVDHVINALQSINIEILYAEDGLQHMYLNGEDVTKEIRLPEISMYASHVSAIPEVRAFLMDMQRHFAEVSSVIMDGRDIATVVLPKAEVKIFLTASAEVRAYRRCEELKERGTPQPYAQVLQDVQTRDYNDSHRAIAPLKAADDAEVLDTSDMSFEESFQAICQIIRKKVF